MMIGIHGTIGSWEFSASAAELGEREGEKAREREIVCHVAYEKIVSQENSKPEFF